MVRTATRTHRRSSSILQEGKSRYRVACHSSTNRVNSLNIPSIQDLSSASSIQPLLTNSLSQCPTTNYLVLLQQGVSSDDYICPKNTPFLKDRIGASGDKAQTSTMVRDVVGSIDMTDVVSTISTSCNKEPELFDITSFPDFSKAEVQSKVFFVSLPQLYPEASIEDRKAVLQQSDNAISSLVERYFDSKDYTLVYATTSISSFSMREQSSEAHEYEPELPLINVMHGGELVRRNLISRKEKSSNQTIVDGDLFAKYQFLSPGMLTSFSTALRRAIANI